MLKRLSASIAAVLISACGGGGDPEPVVVLEPATAKMLMLPVLGTQNCIPVSAYQQMVNDGRFRPYPTDPPEGSIRHPPFLLVPAGSTATVEVAPGLVGTPVVVPGPNGPMNILGLYYVEGETPDWVCTP